MDFSYSNIQLHPEAKTMLFQHYDALTKIFQDVLGLFEVDYMGIAMLNAKHELLFLSSKPSIERNLIEQDLWQHDGSNHIDFFSQQEMKRWDELYSNQWERDLYHYKQKIPKFHAGFSIPSSYAGMSLVYSFAITSNHPAITKNIINNPDMLIRMGRFCLQKITKKISLPFLQQSHAQHKPFLQLVINNEVRYENNT